MPGSADPCSGSLPVSLVGASPDTRNNGVTALCYATVLGLHKRVPGASFTVFDYGRGASRSGIRGASGSDVLYTRCGLVHTKRLYRPEALRRVQWCARFGGLWNGPARRILGSAAVLDISGGDSFTDLYGGWRFQSVTLPKRIALDRGVPLVLLPQTYGPFRSEAARRLASDLVRGSRSAWARDGRSFVALQELLGSAFDPSIHRCGVDVAFSLPACEPASGLPSPVSGWFSRANGPETVGFNISGLIYNSPETAQSRYKFRADYRRVVEGFLSRLLRETDANVLLVPHVVTPSGHYESDIGACESALCALESSVPTAAGRVAVAPAYEDPCEVKWLIGRCSWFCGTRMHATIAALGSCVPTATVTYSPKAQGVFETCGLGDATIDPTVLCTEDAESRLWEEWSLRASRRAALVSSLPSVRATAESQMDAVSGVIASAAGVLA